MYCMNAPIYLRLDPLYSCSFSQASFVSCTSTLSMHLDTILSQVSPTPTGRTLGCLSRPVKWPSMSKRYVSHVGRLFANHFENSAKICQSSLIAPPKRSSQC